MDPLSLIIAALVTGAAKVAEDTAPDAYNGLKMLIKRKFAEKGKLGAEYVLQKHEEKPEDWKQSLKAELVEVDADKDEQIIKKAQELLEQVKPEESVAGKYKLEFQGEVQGPQIGEKNIQENKFF